VTNQGGVQALDQQRLEEAVLEGRVLIWAREV